MTQGQSTTLDLALVLIVLVVAFKIGIPKRVGLAFEWHQPPTLTWPSLFGGGSVKQAPPPTGGQEGPPPVNGNVQDWLDWYRGKK